MDIWRLLSAALRRWYVILVVLALSALAAWGVGSQIQPEYTAGASVLLVPPVQTDLGNPYSDLGTATASVPIVLGSGPVRSEFLIQGLSADYDVGTISRTPILRFTVRANDAAVAVGTADALIQRTVEELADRQDEAGVPIAAQVGLNVLEPPAGATSSSRSQLQAQVAVMGVGLVLGFLAAVFLDDLVLLWRQRQVAASERRARSARAARSRQGSARRSTAGAEPDLAPPVDAAGRPDEAPNTYGPRPGGGAPAATTDQDELPTSPVDQTGPMIPVGRSRD